MWLNCDFLSRRCEILKSNVQDHPPKMFELKINQSKEIVADVKTAVFIGDQGKPWDRWLRMEWTGP